MTTKIRGYQWAMTFRGFELYAARRQDDFFIAQPCDGITSEELTGKFETVADAINAHWELQGL